MVRCGIYTRKSSEEGLEQAFNSLDAQREACEAYVTSQRSEGWIVLPQMYDDGGISGGTMERPALKRLLADIGAGLIDTVVVYKVDRLTRSLGDFARIVDVFDAANVSFVSVTQSFNTTTSMGRLTLNMLLSFAQFEREVTGERIRDKIAASKARGMWMGGRQPLGYTVRDRKLEVDPTEAETIRHIFRRYADLGSVIDLRDELATAGIVTKRQVAANGTVTGGIPFERGALYHLLQNRLYRGQICHKGAVYAGEHEAIIDEGLWNQVQMVLAGNGHERIVRSDAASPSLLAGLIYDDGGIPMTPTHANKNGRRYRYYVSHDLIAPKGAPDTSDDQPSTPKRRGSARRIPARDLEGLVEGEIVRFLADSLAIDALMAPRASDIEDRKVLVASIEAIAKRWSGLTASAKIKLFQTIVVGISVRAETIEIRLSAPGIATIACAEHSNGASNPIPNDRAHLEAGEIVALTVPATLRRVGLEMRHLVEPAPSADSRKPDRSLLRLLGQAQRFRDLLLAGDGRSINDLARYCGVSSSWFTRILRLGFLAPDIASAILAGRQPIDLSAKRLGQACELAANWDEQRRALGFG